MKKPSHLFAAFTLSAALLLSGCSISTDATTASSTTSAVNASSVSGPVTELSYSDLAIDEADLSFDVNDAVDVALADGASEGGDGVRVDGDIVTITAAGTYRLSGTLPSGSLVVDAPDGVVNLVLDGVDITAADVAAINVVEADQVVVWLADGTNNSLADTADSAVDDTVEDSPNATLFSTADLWIASDGALSVTAYAADAITSKDTLVMASGDVSVTDEPDAAVGVVWIDGGTLNLTADSDAIDAARQVTVLDGDLTIAAGDDGIHSDNVLRIAGGDVSITESVEGIEGIEGIEGAYMYLAGGDVSVVASDDGVNVSGGAEELAETTADSTTDTAAEPGAMPGGRPEGGRPEGGGPIGGPPMDETTTTDPVDDLAALTVSAMDGSGFGGRVAGDNGTRFLEFSGGTYVIDTTSDGVDVNGSMSMTGGTLVVSGTEDARQGALDVDDAFTISGGTLAANGMATMAVAPGEDSTQATLALTLSGVVPAGTVITIADTEGTQISFFTTLKASESYIYSSDPLEAGAEYTISVGGEVTGPRASVGSSWTAQPPTAPASARSSPADVPPRAAQPG